MAGIMQMMLMGAGKFVFRQTIAPNTLSYNLRSAAIAAGWDGVTPLDASVTVDPGKVTGATNTSAYAFDTGVGFPEGSRLALLIDTGGYIVGAGGQGHAYNTGGYAQAGGPALRAQFPIEITNRGTIGGGGGGGDRNGSWNSGGTLAGGGGAGYPAGAGGVSAPFSYWGAVTEDYGSYPAQAGTLTGGGSGQYLYAQFGSGEDGAIVGPGQGMAGGGLGQAGAAAPSNNSDPGAGGAAVVGNSFITWIETGTRLGSIS